MRPGLGRIVIVRTPSASNGAYEHPAIITRAWGNDDTRNAPQLVNVMVLPDCGTPYPLTSVTLYNHPALAASISAPCAWWPERE